MSYLRLNHLLNCLVVVSVSSFAGCTSGSFMYGYTEGAALYNFLKVDEEKKSFGYKRILYNIEYRGGEIDKFIAENGMPNYIYEYREHKLSRLALYYTDKDLAYLFAEEDWRPDSMHLVGSRQIERMEWQEFEKLN